MYSLIRKSLFLFDAEKVHYLAMNALHLACSNPVSRAWVTKSFQPSGSYSKELFGLHFKNPVGLAAGFDKNALYLNELESLGFGFVELGTVTPRPQAGNDRPRLFRLPADKALVNRMGFNNDGVRQVASRVAKWRSETSASRSLVIGGNIGKNKATPNDEAWKDYETCFRELFDYVDYFVVNVSSPNTPGLRELQEKESLRKILGHLQTINNQQPRPKPVLLKIAPDLTVEQLDDVIALAMEIDLDGLVASNTTISRENLTQASQKQLESIGAGGLSGAPLKNRSTEIVRYINHQTKGKVPVIASGGIFTGDDAKEKLDAGAELVQVWTGFVYEGPAIVKNICKQL